MRSSERWAGFRTTCSTSVGFGHVRRTLTLARELAGKGWRCIFCLAGEVGRQLVHADGFETVPELDPAPLDAVVLDDYALTASDIAAFHRASRLLAVVDDLADRPLDCDLVVNGGAAAPSLSYRVPGGCTLMLGPRHALLRSAFRGLPRRVAGDVRRVLVALGGSDPQGRSPEVVRQLRQDLPGLELDVVAGPLYAGPALQSAEGVRVFHAPTDLVTLMLEADLAVTAGGQTTYELAACGVPAVALCAAENQRANLAALAAVPTLLWVEDPRRISASVATLVADVSARRRMIAAGQALVDGLGAHRVSLELERRAASGRPPSR